MIIRIENMGGGAWLGRSRDGTVSHNAAADYFPSAAITATPAEGDVVFYEATLNPQLGELEFGAASTLEAYEAS